MQRGKFIAGNGLPQSRSSMSTSVPIVTPSQEVLSSLPDERLQQLLTLQKAANKINTILDLDQLIDKIVNDIACSFGCAEITVFLHDAEQAELILAGVKGCTTHRKGHRLKVG